MTKYLIISLLCFTSLIVNSQTPLPTGFPVQKNLGRTEWGYVQSDSGHIIAVRDTSWLPRFAGTIILWQRPAIDTAYWFYTGSKWMRILRSIDVPDASRWELDGSNNLQPKTFAGNQVQISNKSFLLTGATGAIPTTATGVHLYWYPAKRAFRAGEAFSTEWSDANTGDYSMAFGESARASGFSSLAIGSGVIASGSNSISIGNGNEATQSGSLAIGGDGNVSSATGAIATGTSTRARASYSFVGGRSTHTNITTRIPQFSIGSNNDTARAGELFRIGWVTVGPNKTIFSVDTLGRVKIGKADNGAAEDSILVWSGADSLVKKVYRFSVGDTSLVTNVMKYGAVPDGITDNTNAINNAIIDAQTNGKPIVFFPPGIYMVRAAYRDTAVAYKPKGIVVKSDITLQGSGMGNTVIKLAAPPISSTFAAVSAPISYATNTTFSNIISGTNVSNVVLRDFSINGNIANQINYNINPYLTPQDSTHTDSCETDAIKFWFGENNRVINVRIDSVAGYGIANFGSINQVIDRCVVTTSVNGGVYYTREAFGSVLVNSLITNNNADNVRIRSNYITIQNNEISWTPFNPNIAQANFAGVYIECDSNTNLMPPSIIGVKVIGNYIHDNSSYGVDAFNRDTLIYTAQGYSVLVANNTISYNANSGVTLHMPMMEIRNNQILENGANSLNQQDPVTYRGVGVAANASGVGCVISGNSFRDTRGFQDYAIGGAAPDYPRMLQVTNNVAQGGDGFMQATSNLYDNPFYGNSWLANAASAVQSDFFQRQLTGNLLISPPSNGVDFGSGGANFYSALRHGASQEAFFVSQRTGTNLMGFGVSDRAIYAPSGTGTNAGRDWRVYDFVTAASRIGVNADGEFYVGANQTTYSTRIRQRGINNNNTGQLYVPSAGVGSTANEVQSGIFSDVGAGYTGSGTHPAIRAANAAVQTGNNSGGAGTFRGALGFYGGSTGVSTAGVGAGGLFFSISSNTNVGVIADATVSQRNDAGARSIGLEAFARKAHASAIQIGAYIGFDNTQPTYQSAALLVDNSGQTDPIFLARDNGSVVAGIYDGGEMMIGSTSDQGSYTLQNTGGLYQSGAVRMNLGSDAALDMYYRASGGDLTRLPTGTALQQLRVNSGATGYEWFTPSSTTTIYTGDGTATNRTVTISGFLNFTGANVGINTAGADRKLDILDNAAAQLRLTDTDGTTYADFRANANGQLTIVPTGKDVIIPTGNIANVSAKLGGVIWNAISQVTTSGTTETDLYTYTTPTNTLGVDGEWLEFTVEGVAGNAEVGVATFRVYWAGTEVFEADYNAVGGQAYSVVVKVYRTSSSNARVTAYAVGAFDFVAGATPNPRITEVTTTFSATNIIKCTGIVTDDAYEVDVRVGNLKWWPQNLPGL